MKIKYFKLAIWIISFLAVSSFIGSITRMPDDPWYDDLTRSPLTPPSYVFGIVWTILYIMIAISGWLIWEEKCKLDISVIKKVYILQLILNWSWMPIFFKYHLVGLALVCLVIITILVALLIYMIFYKQRLSSLLLIPYLVWLFLACHLNSYIWLYN